MLLLSFHLRSFLQGPLQGVLWSLCEVAQEKAKHLTPFRDSATDSAYKHIIPMCFDRKVLYSQETSDNERAW